MPFSPLHVFGWPNDRKAPRCVPPKPLTQKSPWPPSPLLRARAPNPTAPAGPLERPRLPQPGGGLTPPTACYSLPTRQSLLSLPVHGPAQPPPARPPPAHMHRTILGGPAEAHAGGRCTLAGAAPRATDGQLAERGGGARNASVTVGGSGLCFGPSGLPPEEAGQRFGRQCTCNEGESSLGMIAHLSSCHLLVLDAQNAMWVSQQISNGLCVCMFCVGYVVCSVFGCVFVLFVCSP